MRPIEPRVEAVFSQAMRCVEYRLPRTSALRPSGWIAALGIRYGMIGTAAAYHLLEGPERGMALDSDPLRTFSCSVERHVRWDLWNRLPLLADASVPTRVAVLAAEVLQGGLNLFRRGCPLEMCLAIAHEEFRAAHDREIVEGWGLFGGRRARREFDSSSQESLKFALAFFERRQYELEEVPAIALLGE